MYVSNAGFIMQLLSIQIKKINNNDEYNYRFKISFPFLVIQLK